MSRVTREVWKCDKCTHEWLSPIVAQQCPKCRSRKWNELDRLAEPVQMSQSDSGTGEQLSESHSLKYAPLED